MQPQRRGLKGGLVGGTAGLPGYLLVLKVARFLSSQPGEPSVAAVSAANLSRKDQNARGSSEIAKKSGVSIKGKDVVEENSP
jgi:hypothetical protein